MNIAKITAEVEKQAGDFSTVVLDRDDALRLVAVARAAVEMINAENDFRAFYGFTGADTKRVLERRFAAFAALDSVVRGDALASGGEEGE